MVHHLIDQNIQKRFEVNGISKQIQDNQYCVIEKLVQKYACPNMRTLEIGSWTGLSAVIIGEVVSRVLGTHYCVDWFKGSDNDDGHLKETAKKYDIKQIFKDNIEYFHLDNTISLFDMSSEKASKLMKPESLDFIFIDGDHNPEAVLLDINLWLPKLKLDGGLCGHDYEACKDVINTRFKDVEVNKDIWHIHRTKL